MSTENKKMTNCTSCGTQIAKNAKACPQCGAKNKKPFYKRGWFIALIVVVVIAIISSAGGGGDTDAPATQSQPTGAQSTENNQVQEEAEIEYNAYEVAELIDDLQSNALKAEEKYNNQYVEITGKLATIDSDGKYITLNPTNNEYNFINVQCYIKNDEQKSKILEMSKGDIVTLKGKIKSVGEVLGYTLDIDSIN